MNDRWRRVKRLKALEARSMDYNSHELSVYKTKRVIKAMGDAADESHMSPDSLEKLGEALRLQVQAEAELEAKREAAEQKAAEKGSFGHQVHRLKEALKGFLPRAITKHFRA